MIKTLSIRKELLKPHEPALISHILFEQIEDRASIVPLVAGLRKDVLALISEGIALVWESYKLEQYVQRLSECVVSFQEKVSPGRGIFMISFPFPPMQFSSNKHCPFFANIGGGPLGG